MEFSTIKLSDKQRIEAALAPLARNDSSLGFANIFGMQEKYGTRFCIEDNALYLRQDARVPGMRAYYPPLGTNDLAGSIARLAEEAMLDGPFAFVNVTPEEKHLLQAAGMPWTFTTDRNFAEYLYRTEDIAEYRGAERAKKRREVRKFFQLYGPRVRIDAIGPGNLDAVANYQCAWFFANMSRRMSPEHPLESEHRKILLELDRFHELDLEGIALFMDNAVAGYAYGSMLAGGAFDVMVLKGTLSYRFIWRTILQEMAKRVAERAALLNLEEDLGLPGLRENKESYGPCSLLHKYQAIVEA